MIRLPFSRLARRSLIALALGTLCLALTPACSAPPPPTPPAPVVKTPQARAQWYQDCWNAYNAKDWDKFAMCYTETATSENIDATPPTATGRVAIIEREKKGAEQFPDRRGDVLLVLVNGARMMSIAAFTGTNTGPMTGPDGKAMPATNKKIGLYMAHVIDLDGSGSMATRDASYFEEGTMLAQLGVLKQPSRPVLVPTGAPAVVVIAENDEKERTNLAKFQMLADATNKHDLKAMDALMADGYKLIEIGQAKDLDAKTSLQSTKDFFAAFSDLSMAPTSTWAAGDYVVLEGAISGTNDGAWPAMGLTKKTGKTIRARFLEVMKFEGGKVKEDWLFYNGTAMAAQLGMK